VRGANPARLEGWLIVLALAQIAALVATQIWPLAQKLWHVRDEDAVVRSARLSYGADFAGYVTFLRQSIPEDALVVIPSREEDPVLGEMPFLQYFLFPRRLTNCPTGTAWTDCAAHYHGPETYLLVVGDFPPREGLDASREYLAYDSERGVLAPGAGHGGE
jgi:hypothetical protein